MWVTVHPSIHLLFTPLIHHGHEPNPNLNVQWLVWSFQLGIFIQQCQKTRVFKFVFIRIYISLLKFILFLFWQHLTEFEHFFDLKGTSPTLIRWKWELFGGHVCNLQRATILRSSSSPAKLWALSKVRSPDRPGLVSITSCFA